METFQDRRGLNTEGQNGGGPNAAAKEAAAPGAGALREAERAQKEIAKTIAEELGVKLWQVEAAISLIDEGNTIPFIARYRKEATGTLDDEQLRALDERLSYLRNLEEKKAKVLEAIEAQGKLTKELRARIEAAKTQVAVDDLYRPFRPKRKTRAGTARERGLLGLADWILEQAADHPALEEAQKYVSEEKEVPDAQAALQGAKDIIAELVSDNAGYRAWIREATEKEGFLISSRKAASGSSGKSAAKEDGEAAGGAVAKASGRKAPAKAASEKEDRSGVYEMYFEYEERVGRIPGHRVLAINRGEKEGYLAVKLDAPAEKILQYLHRQGTQRQGILRKLLVAFHVM